MSWELRHYAPDVGKPVQTDRATSLPGGLPIPAGDTISLTPSASHMMINGLDERLEEGQTLDLTLIFDVAGDVTVNFDVLALNARSHPEMDHSGHGDHGTTEFDQASVTGDGLKGAENMMSAGIDHATAMRLSDAQSTAEAALAPNMPRNSQSLTGCCLLIRMLNMTPIPIASTGTEHDRFNAITASV